MIVFVLERKKGAILNSKREVVNLFNLAQRSLQSDIVTNSTLLQCSNDDKQLAVLECMPVHSAMIQLRV
jgi:hypothetical protein